MTDYGSRRRSDHNFPGDRRRSRSPVHARFNGKTQEPPRVIDPFTITEHVSYDYFCNWYLNLNPGASIDVSMQNRYEDYTTDLLARTAKPYISQQIEQPWFQDLYDDIDHSAALKSSNLTRFRNDLEHGVYKEFTIELPGSATDYAMDSRIPSPLILDGEISPQILFISNIPSTVSRSIIEEHIKNITSTLEHLSISRPTTTDLSRTCWLVLRGDANSTEVRAQLDGTVLNATTAGTFTLKVAHYRKPALSARPKILWTQLNEEGLVKEHLGHVNAVVGRLSTTTKLGDEEIVKSVESQTISPRQRLDLLVEYLRIVHSFDYWDLKQYDSLMDLESHAPKYTRSTGGPASNTKSFEDWRRIYERKLHIYLNPDEYLQQLRVKSVSDLVAEVISSKVKTEEESRFRCQVQDCTKLFMDVPFVKKHIEKRHSEWVAKISMEAQLSVRYMADLHKILPYREYHEPRPRRQSSPARRRRSPHGGQQQRNGSYGGPRGGRGDFRGAAAQNYRDLDRPAEELPELDY